MMRNYSPIRRNDCLSHLLKRRSTRFHSVDTARELRYEMGAFIIRFSLYMLSVWIILVRLIGYSLIVDIYILAYGTEQNSRIFYGNVMTLYDIFITLGPVCIESMAVAIGLCLTEVYLTPKIRQIYDIYPGK